MKYRRETLLAAFGALAITIVASVNVGLFSRTPSVPPSPQRSAECQRIWDEYLAINRVVRETDYSQLPATGFDRLMSDTAEDGRLRDLYASSGCQAEAERLGLDAG